MIKIEKSKSGVDYARTEKIQIHSAYDPVKEAKRFINESNLIHPGTIIVLGSGLGYITIELNKLFPESKIISIYLSNQLYINSKIHNSYSWHPESKDSLLLFLRKSIFTLELEGLRLLEWPPAAAAFPKISNKINKIINQFIRENNGSIITTSRFGKKWISNTIINAVNINYYKSLPISDKPVFITASGPSLVKSFNFLREVRDEITLWALPSSLNALLYEKIIPDLIIQTDPGYYATLHLRQTVKYEIPVAMPLSAVSGNGEFKTVISLSNSTFFENVFIKALNLNVKIIPSNGTVAGTAVNLALNINNLPIFIAGLDFCYKDIQSHVKPHSFDPLFRIDISRLEPELCKIYSRTLSHTDINKHGIRTSMPLQTYSGWFNNITSDSGSRIYRLFPSEVFLKGIISITPIEAKKLIGNISKNTKTLNNEKVLSVPERNKRVQIAQNIISGWKNKIERLNDHISKGNTFFEELLTDDSIFNLLYYINLPALIDTRKYLKKRDNKSYQKSINSLFTEVYEYLEKIDNRIKSI